MSVESIRPVRDANYYLEEPSMTTPVYRGKLASILGIEGQKITPESFNQLFAGRTPDGTRLPKYMHPERRGAFEVTINLPKCASVQAMLAGDSRIAGVLDGVAGQVAAHLQKHALVRVSKGPFKGMDRKPDNLAWAVFTHPTSRAGDPHLHAHVVFFNLSYDRQERAFKAIETRYIDQRAMSDVAQRSMVKGLRQLGYRVQERGREFEIVGVPAEVKATFSQRNAQIKEMEADYPKAAGKAKSKMAVYRRPEKELATLEERRQSWVSRIADGHLQGLFELAKRAKMMVRRKLLGQHLDKIRALALQREDAPRERQAELTR